MNEPNKPADLSDDDRKTSDNERTKQVTVAGWTVGISVVVTAGVLAGSPEWPEAFGVAAIAAMLAFVCSCILKNQ